MTALESQSDGEEPASGIGALPEGCLNMIFDLLRPRDRASVSCVCRCWHKLVGVEAAANLVWRSFYSARWQLSGAAHWPCPAASAMGCGGLTGPDPATSSATSTSTSTLTTCSGPRPSTSRPMPVASASPAASTCGSASASACGSTATSAAATPLSCSPTSDLSCGPGGASPLPPPCLGARGWSPAASAAPRTGWALGASPEGAAAASGVLSSGGGGGGGGLDAGGEVRWQRAYGAKMQRLKSWGGRYSADQVVGHKSAVRAVRLLPAFNLLATASLDRTVRLWDLAAGLPLAASRPHGGTVRCLALGAGLLASGCSDNLVRLWEPSAAAVAAATRYRALGAAPPPALDAAGAGALGLGGGGGGGGGQSAAAVPLFDLVQTPQLLRGHTGPVSCLALDEGGGCGSSGGGGGRGCSSSGLGLGSDGAETLFSGSWDCTVRIWRRREPQASGDDSDDGGGAGACGSSSGGGGGSSGDESGSSKAAGGSSSSSSGWACSGVLGYSDWVYAVAVRAGNLLVAAGGEVVVTDALTGRAVRRFAGLHDGGTVACLEGCRSGRLLFTAAGDGLLLAHDLRMKQGSRVLWHHNSAVTGLSFEDPWVASSAADGTIILQDSEQALAAGGPGPGCWGGKGPVSVTHAATAAACGGAAAGGGGGGPRCRALHCPPGQPALCLDLSDQWLAAGTESGVVRLWDFTGAAAAAERATAARAARSAARAARVTGGGGRSAPAQPQPQLQHDQPAARGRGKAAASGAAASQSAPCGAVSYDEWDAAAAAAAAVEEAPKPPAGRADAAWADEGEDAGGWGGEWDSVAAASHRRGRGGGGGGGSSTSGSRSRQGRAPPQQYHHQALASGSAGGGSGGGGAGAHGPRHAAHGRQHQQHQHQGRGGHLRRVPRRLGRPCSATSPPTTTTTQAAAAPAEPEGRRALEGAASSTSSRCTRVAVAAAPGMCRVVGVEEEAGCAVAAAPTMVAQAAASAAAVRGRRKVVAAVSSGQDSSGGSIGSAGQGRRRVPVTRMR